MTLGLRCLPLRVGAFKHGRLPVAIFAPEFLRVCAHRAVADFAQEIVCGLRRGNRVEALLLERIGNGVRKGLQFRIFVYQVASSLCR